MPDRKFSDNEFVEFWNKYKSPVEMAHKLGMSERAIYSRRRRVERRLNIILPTFASRSPDLYLRDHLSRANLALDDGIIMVASDCHYWPGEPSVAHTAFVKLAKKLKPSVVVMNGDVFDGATNSRHPRAHWETSARPTVKEELETVAARLKEIKKATPDARHIWTLGNHDMRYEARLAQNVPEYEGVAGFSLKDHFPDWIHAMSLMVNDNLMIKHRTNKGGVHATWSNVLHSGSIHIVTGHLHRLQATIFSNYRGHFWGVDTGTLAEVDGDHMGYGEDNAKNHASGFVVLTLVEGDLLYPEFCHVKNNVAYFRGKPV
jgi:predicted phosphodiesterase